MTDLFFETKEGAPNPKYKDTLFRILFGSNKENALSLYNAINGSNYTNVDDLTYTTLENVIYLNVKNDCSFIVGSILNLYEHQSTFNPNMPLRGLIYMASIYRGMFNSRELYSTKPVKIPTPRYIVFYNGAIGVEDRTEMKLSDLFEVEDNSGNYEWKAIMLNINYGHNQNIMEKCAALEGYATLVKMTREYYNESRNQKDALDRAVLYCIENDILKDTLTKIRQEGTMDILTEFDEEAFRALMREEGEEIGEARGVVKGRTDERLSAIRIAVDAGLDKSVIINSLKYTEEEYEEALAK